MRISDWSSDVCSSDLSESEIRDYLRESHLQLSNVLLDPFSSVMQESGSRGLPTTLFFDADGRLVDTHMGELSNASLAVKLRRFGAAPSSSLPTLPTKEVP